jgi:hypothetical protein
MFSNDCLQEVVCCFAAGEAGAAIALLVEAGQDGSIFIKESSDSKPIVVDDNISQVGQRLQC